MASELKPVYLIWGSDRPKIARALQRLRERFPEDPGERLDAATASGADAVAACNALGLFGGGGRLVIVGGVERWRGDDAKAIAAYLANPTPETVLALVGDELKRDSPLAKSCAKGGELLVYEVSKRALPGWVADQFARAGATVQPAACRALVELVGDDLEELAAEIDKLATWADGETIDERRVLELAAGRAETSIFALTDAWGQREVGATLAAAEALLERGSGGRRDELPRIVGLMASHVARVRRCQAWAAEGVTPREAASRMKRAPFYVEKLFAQAANFGEDELREAICRLADLDLALKGDSRLSGELELELGLIAITRPREAAAQA